jgi:hypothetical protein
VQYSNRIEMNEKNCTGRHISRIVIRNGCYFVQPEILLQFFFSFSYFVTTEINVLRSFSLMHCDCYFELHEKLLLSFHTFSAIITLIIAFS